jgi:DNA replication protein DnaC
MKKEAVVCPQCEDTGWKPIGYGAERKVARCDCKVAVRGDHLLAAAHIPARYEHCELESFDTTGSRSGLAASLLAARRFVEEYPVERTGLLLVGRYGVGKTHLAIGIIKSLIVQKSIPCLFCDYRELFKDIQDSWHASVEATEMSILRPIFETEVLLLDDLGAMKPTDWKWDTVSHILNTRYNRNLTTIFTSNFPDEPSRIEYASAPKTMRESAERAARQETLGDRITDRMRSRLHEMCRVVEMQGDDFRQTQKGPSLRNAWR